jgi:hypothetical protein
MSDPSELEPLSFHFQSTVLLADMLQMFPNCATDELKEITAEGIPLLWAMPLTGEHFVNSLLVKELSETLLLFFYLINLEEGSRKYGEGTETHKENLTRALPAFGNIKRKTALGLLGRFISLKQRDYLGLMPSRSMLSARKAVYTATDALYTSRPRPLIQLKHFYKSSTLIEHQVLPFIDLIYYAPTIPKEHEAFLLSWRGRMATYKKIQKLVNLYFPAEERERLLYS